ncbi:MAG: glycosyltransferase, partial [Ignavibacteriales bacterium]|nr:glycosyltransferase [Ignavibacteriales bacterium]
SLFFPGKTQLDPGLPLFQHRTSALIDSINPLTWRRAGRSIAQHKPDVVIFRYWMPFFAPAYGTMARIIKKHSNARIIFVCDNVLPHERHVGDIQLTKFAFAPVDGFVVLSGAVERELRSLIPAARILNTPHPLYDVFGEPIPREAAQQFLGVTGRRVLLFFGYVRAYKGLDVLLEAMPAILKKVDATLVVAGEFYEDEEKYRQQIRRLQLEERVKVFSDYVPNQDIAKFFCASDAVVLPYRSATQSGIVQVAYHFNVPVIATNVGALSEVVVEGRTGFLVPPEDPQLLANAVVRLYEEHCREKFSDAIVEEKKKYSWEFFVSRLQQFWNELH